MKLNTLRAYSRESSGQVAVFFALVALPLLICISAALDYTNAVSQKTKVKNALDAAVLAAMNNNALKPSEKEDYALKYFTDNYSGKVPVKLNATATENDVTLSGEAAAELSIGKALGMKEIVIRSTSRAEIASENTICVLALGTSGTGVSFSGGLAYDSPTCSVHSNSRDAKAIVSTSSAKPSAKSFCAVGGTRGNYEPYAKGECKQIEDPYKDVIPPMESWCSPIAALQGASSNSSNPYANSQLVNDIGGFVGGIQDNVILIPGTYCGGVSITGKNIVFLPGDYIMLDGPLRVVAGAQATAENVTIAFKGTGAQLQIDEGSDFVIKAPATGPRAGLAFMEVIEGSASNDSAVNYIRGGSALSVTGTVYFPTQEIEVKGGVNTVGSKAPATSFIARSLTFTGDKGSKIDVKVDHVSAGIPPIMPRAEDGVRLAQ